jgi:NADPH-dependent curcumin reductase CurA
MSTATRAASREFHLVARPDGEPTPDLFALVEAELDPPAAGEVLVRNTYLSVERRGRRRCGKSSSALLCAS